MTTKVRTALAAAAAGLVVATAAAAPAQAGTQAVDCQSDAVAAVLTIPDSNGMGSEERDYACAGVYPVNAKAALLEAKGWSGRLYTRESGTLVFCDWQVIRLRPSRYVWSIALSATRLRECR